MFKTVANPFIVIFSVIAIGYAFIGLAVMGGLVEPESIPLWPTSPVACAQEPRFNTTEYAAGIEITVTIDGAFDAAGINEYLLDSGYDVAVVLVPAVPEHVARYLPGASQTPESASTLELVEPALRRSVGQHSIVIGPGFDEGEWMLPIGCHTPEDETPTYLG